MINQSEVSCNKMVELNDDKFKVGHLEPRPFRPFKSSEEYLYAMKEDLAEWLNDLYHLNVNVNNFMEKLETGVVLCRHANNIIKKAKQCGTCGLNPKAFLKEVNYKNEVVAGTFQARDNISQFIGWCRTLEILDCLLFETDDLVLRKNEKSFILCLLEIARRGSKLGIAAPMLVQMEQEIDRELARLEDENNFKKDDSKVEKKDTEKPSQVNNLKNLHEMVTDILSRCSCPAQFPMIKVADGKYRIGNTKVLIFVRILRNHVMVRVGGGWTTLGHYLDRHDPCRCRSGHRFSTSAKVTVTAGVTEPQMMITYNRPKNSNPTIQKSKLNLSPKEFLKQNNQLSNIDGYYNDLNGKSPSFKSEQVFQESPPLSLINPIIDTRTSPSRIIQSPIFQCSDDSIESSSVASVASVNMGNSSPLNENLSLNGIKSTSLDFDYHDSSSSEYSENEVSFTTNAKLTGIPFNISRNKKCSPRKIMKTNNTLETTKSSQSFNKAGEVNKSLKTDPSRSTSCFSSETLVKLSKNEKISKTSNQVKLNPFQRNNRLRASDQKFLKSCSITSTKNFNNLSKTSENLSKNLDQTKLSNHQQSKDSEKNLNKLSSMNKRLLFERSNSNASSYEKCQNYCNSHANLTNHCNKLENYKPKEQNYLTTRRTLSNLSQNSFLNKNQESNILAENNHLNKSNDIKNWNFKQKLQLSFRKKMINSTFENSFNYSDSPALSLRSSTPLKKTNLNVKSKSIDSSTSPLLIQKKSSK